MPVRYAVLNGGDLVLESWTGPISHQDLIKHEQQHLSDPDVNAGASVLADATQALFETTPELVHELSDLYQRTGNRLRVSKCALLVSSDAYERARRYAKEAQGHGVSIIIFGSIDVGCTWLGIDPTIVQEELKKLREKTGT